MDLIVKATVRGFRDLFQFKVLWIVIWPLLVATFSWLIIGAVFWDTFSEWIANGLAAIGVQPWLDGLEPRWVANTIQGIAHLFLFVPLVFISALLITAVFGMPALIALVAERDFPQLSRENGGSITANLLNAALAIVIFIAIWIVSLPLWFIGVGVVIPFVAAAYLNQRLFRFDALAEHASSEELQALFTRYQSSWWGLGLLTGLLQFVPILNLFAPVLTALTFIHFGLDRLQELRGEEAHISLTN